LAGYPGYYGDPNYYYFYETTPSYVYPYTYYYQDDSQGNSTSDENSEVIPF
jgi:hypothetical protein